MTSDLPIPSHSRTPAPSSANDRFFSAAIPRMMRLLPILGGVFTVLAAWRFGWRIAVGFAAGAFIAYLSFRSLNHAVQALASRIVEAHRPERGFSLVSGFFLRYLLAGAVAYVIFTSSSQAFRGFLFGLCTPVGAMLLEAVFEAYMALRRGY
jgi:hypothetical protein